MFWTLMTYWFFFSLFSWIVLSLTTNLEDSQSWSHTTWGQFFIISICFPYIVVAFLVTVLFALFIFPIASSKRMYAAGLKFRKWFFERRVEPDLNVLATADFYSCPSCGNLFLTNDADNYCNHCTQMIGRSRRTRTPFKEEFGWREEGF